jgi:hypothetical protein
MTDDDLDRQIARALAARRPPPLKDFETRLQAGTARPHSPWLVPALASVVAVAAIVVLVWRVPERAPATPPAQPQHDQRPPAQPGAPAIPGGSGQLVIDCRPQARVTIDDTYAGTTPLTVQLAPGDHRVELAAGARTVVKHLVIGPNERQELRLVIE